jgi:DNA-binding NarL/FixJ family response regulator
MTPELHETLPGNARSIARQAIARMTPRRLRLLLLDPDIAFAGVLRSAWLVDPRVESVSCCHDAHDALSIVWRHSKVIDAALVDLSFIEARPGEDRHALLAEFASIDPGLERIALGATISDNSIFSAFAGGATGYLLKSSSPAQLLTALIETKHGGAAVSPQVVRRILVRLSQLDHLPGETVSKESEAVRLAPRERQIMQLLAQGLTYPMIADELGIALGTLQRYVRGLYRKLQITTKAEAAAIAIRRRLLR